MDTVVGCTAAFSGFIRGGRGGGGNQGVEQEEGISFFSYKGAEKDGGNQGVGQEEGISLPSLVLDEGAEVEGTRDHPSSGSVWLCLEAVSLFFQ